IDGGCQGIGMMLIGSRCGREMLLKWGADSACGVLTGRSDILEQEASPCLRPGWTSTHLPSQVERDHSRVEFYQH
ncbi:MAG: hypothetical protein NTW28_00035, partial [Candidatus Solibacter sp.]|nr:hypothetical protein [Candidatus Solibacter sp.]